MCTINKNSKERVMQPINFVYSSEVWASRKNS